MRRPSLRSQVLAVNSLLVTAAVVVAVVAAETRPLTSGTRELMILALALTATVLGNVALLRRRFTPLERLAETMAEVDLNDPGLRASLHQSGSRDVVRLNSAFNRMLDRIEAERREAGRAVLHAQEQERHRVAQDLHDEVNQALTGILLHLEAMLQRAPKDLRDEVRQTKALANQAMEELLDLARQLRPAALDDHGLIPALHSQVRDFADRTGIRCEFRRKGVVPPLGADEQLVIYRVTQESLSNVAQHAGAEHVDVELSFVGRTVLRVADDGHGLRDGRPWGPRRNGSTPSRNGGFGITGMRERALLVGGQLTIYSGEGHGTTVELTMGGRA